MEEINLKELFDYFLSKILILVIITVVVLIFGNIYTLFIKTPLYNSTTTLVLVSRSNDDSTITQNDITLNNNLVGTYREIIKSKNVLGQVAGNLKLKQSSGSLANSVTVSSVSNSQVIKITVSNANNKKAKLIADEIAKVFIKEAADIYNINNIAVIDEASVEGRPYNMNIIKENAIYFVVGIALSMGVILLMYSLDTTINSEQDIEEKLELTILGKVPKVGENKG